MRGLILTTAFGAGAMLAGLSAANAADVLPYPAVPPIGDAVYVPQPMVTGDIAGGVSYYAEEGGYNVWDVFGSGRINMPLGAGPWYFTGEVAALAALNEYHYYDLIGVAHVYHKTQQAAHGVFVSGTAYGEVGFNGHELATGIEGAAFLGSFTLAGALSYTWGDNDDGAYSGWNAFGMAKYYLTPNTSVYGEAGVWGNASGWTLGGGAEHLFAGTDMSIFTNANWYDEEGDTAWQATVGLRLFFHNPGATLQQRDWDSPFATLVY